MSSRTAPPPVTTNARPASAGPLSDLEAELAEKSHLVEALTSQLERAAEEIDRLHRSGADRKRSAALPAELVEDHRQVVAEMQRVVQQWEDLQAGFALGRIEVQLTELREFVGERLVGPVLPAFESSPPEAVLREPTPLSLGKSHEESPDPSVSAWEQLKSQMLLDPTPTEPESPTVAPIADYGPLPEPPAAIETAHADREALVHAIDARDQYIVALMRRLRAAEEIPAVDWAALIPESPGLVEHVQTLVRQLEEKLRLTEVELSMERAQLTRAQMQVAAQQEGIDKQLKRLGVATVEELAGHAAGINAAPDRRWTRFLGTPRK